MGKLTISMAMFNSYFDITRGYPNWFVQIAEPIRQRRRSSPVELFVWDIPRPSGVFFGKFQAEASCLFGVLWVTYRDTMMIHVVSWTSGVLDFGTLERL